MAVLGKVLRSRLLNNLADLPISLLIVINGFALKVLSRWPGRLPLSRRMSDIYGISVRSHHYYEPTFNPKILKKPLSEPRYLPGIDFNETRQVEILRSFHFNDELIQINEGKRPDEFGFDKGMFGSGDAETLYNFIRYLKPLKIIEVGSGSSTLIARMALKRNQDETPTYRCDHRCIEPYEQPWLEGTGATVMRERVEDVDLNIFRELDTNDILFIDSSHVVRPQGDVLYEFLEIIPSLKPGVFIHVHDIFTPRDYPDEWIINNRALWNEQYILEAFLSNNEAFEIVCAVNWLKYNHWSELSATCPILARQPAREPGSFWFRRK